MYMINNSQSSPPLVITSYPTTPFHIKSNLRFNMALQLSLGEILFSIFVTAKSDVVKNAPPETFLNQT